MEKIYSLALCILALGLLTFASCATQPSTTSTNNSRSPLERSNGNGLASYMH